MQNNLPFRLNEVTKNVIWITTGIKLLPVLSQWVNRAQSNSLVNESLGAVIKKLKVNLEKNFPFKVQVCGNFHWYVQDP